LQWCDQETLAWLRFLLRFVPEAPLLLLGTVRSEELVNAYPLYAFTRELQVSEQLTTIELPPLSAMETAALAAQVSKAQLDNAAVNHLVHTSEGNPLFIVEMVQSGGWPVPTIGVHAAVGEGQTLPPKVYAVIQQRLAQLSPAARTLAALAATIGRSFTFDLLCAASERGEDEVVNGLDELWRRKIIRERGANDYDFSHDRIRDVTYAAISPILRPQLHKRVALALEEHHCLELDAVSAQLAAHYERAGLATKAIEFYQCAAAAEATMLAHTNAVTYLDLGLTLLRQQPYTVERVQQELTLLLNKAHSLSVQYGFTAPGIAAICNELEDCLPRIIDEQLKFQVFQRLRGYYGTVGNMNHSHQYAKYLLEIAPRLENPLYRLGAYQANGIVNLQLGHFSRGIYYMEQGAKLYAKHGEDTTRHALSDTSMVGLFANHAFTLWLLGYPARAQRKATEAVAFAEALQDPFHITVALFFASMIYRYCHAVELTADAAQKMLALDAQYGFPLTHASGLVADGWAMTQHDDRIVGIARMCAGIDEMKAMGHAMFQP
ncbi:MAG: hypothetical protein KDE31_25330, partial [Caldilineaceae bacterium]|nr:hypothetical protein [Caldilineaceae bacterium]